MEFELKNAFEHIDRLAYEIGPRIAGTRGERMAAEYIAGKFRELGLDVKVQSFRFKRRSTVIKTSRLIFLASFIGILILQQFQSAILWAAALVLGFSVKWFLPSSESRNILARKIVKEPKRRIAICAHYDTAHCIRWPSLHLYGRFAMKPLIAIITVLLAIRFFVQLPWEMVWTSCGLLFIPACLSPFLTMRGDGSPGADDNASGVAVMLECARVLAEDGGPDRELTFVAFGAEEQGLAGSKEAAKGGLLRDSIVLNLDTLGCEERLAIVEGNGTIRRVRTDRGMNTTIEGIMRREGLQPTYVWSAISSHDHIPLIRAGVRATTLSSAGAGRDAIGRFIGKIIGMPNAVGRVHPHIHSPTDVPDKISPDNIENAGKIVLEFVKIF